MPLTLAHPAAILPFVRKRFVLSALVVGSMAPDFSKYVTLSPATSIGHTWLGIFWFCVPVGFVTLYVFHRILKEPLFQLLPVSHQQRLSPWTTSFTFTPFSRFIAIAVSLAIGAFTHLVWDSFTHESGLAVKLLPTLKMTLADFEGRELKLFKILQHGSTIVGISILLFYYFRWLRNAAANPIPRQGQMTDASRKRLWLAFCIVALLTGVVYGIFSAHKATGFRATKLFVGRMTVGTLAVFAAQLFFFSLRQQWRIRRERP